MNFDQAKTGGTEITPEEALAIQKEIFMTSGGMKIGQTMEEYRKEREEIWERMHPGEKAKEEEKKDGVEEEEGKKAQAINERDVRRLEEVRAGLGMSSNEKIVARLKELAGKRQQRQIALNTPEGTRLAIQRLFQEAMRRQSKPEMAKLILEESNFWRRSANYETNSAYGEAWKLATEDNSLNHKVENNWVYRGNFSSKEQKTLTRGSLNVVVTEKVVNSLDDLIKRGIINANYKFGEPGTPAEASDRHDAVTIYFLAEPTEEALKAISEIADENYRGDDLIGRKISRGFYMSEVGSVADTQARDLIQKIDGIDKEIAEVVRDFLTSKKEGKERVAMSEAQFYSTKEMLGLFGINLQYSPESGFVVSKV